MFAEQWCRHRNGDRTLIEHGTGIGGLITESLLVPSKLISGARSPIYPCPALGHMTLVVAFGALWNRLPGHFVRRSLNSRTAARGRGEEISH